MTTKEQIAEGNPFDKYEEAEYGHMPGLLLSDEYKAWKKGAAFVLRIPEIKEGRELWEKRDRLVELDEDQTLPPEIDRFRGQVRRILNQAGFRRVKVKG